MIFNYKKYTATPFQWSIPWCPHLKLFKLKRRSIVTFDPVRCEAISYNHWVFVKIIKNKIVFNNHPYSMTTTRHQSLVRSLMNELGIKIDVELNSKCSLNSPYALLNASENVYNTLEHIKVAMKRKNSRLSTNNRRKSEITKLKMDIQTIKKLGCKLTKSNIDHIKYMVIKEEQLRLSARQEKRTKKQLHEIINGDV